MKSERPVRSSTGPARQFPGTSLALLSAVGESPQAASGARKGRPERQPQPLRSRGTGCAALSKPPLLLSPPKDRLPASSLWLLSGSGPRPAKRSTERPLNQRRQDMAENARARVRAADGSPRSAASTRSILCWPRTPFWPRLVHFRDSPLEWMRRRKKGGRVSESSSRNSIVSNNDAARESEAVPFFRDSAWGQKSSYHEIS